MPKKTKEKEGAEDVTPPPLEGGDKSEKQFK